MVKTYVNPFLSVVIPAYNEEHFIAGCLHSLTNQTLSSREYELIVVDNNSSDKTASISRLFGATVVRETRQSVIIARQAGLLASRGTIILSADADTQYPDNWLSHIHTQFKKNQDLVGIVGWLYFPSSPVVLQIVTDMLQYMNIAYERLTGKCLFAFGCNFAFRADTFRKLGGYSLNLPELGDQLDIVKRLGKTGRIIIDKNSYCYSSNRRHGNMWKTVFLYNGWYRVIGYFINKISGRTIIGSAPPVRTIPAQKFRSTQRGV